MCGHARGLRGQTDGRATVTGDGRAAGTGGRVRAQTGCGPE